MSEVILNREAVLRVGEVTEVSGQNVIVRVDRQKNASDLLFDGDVLKNISVNSYVEIRKGFISLIGKVDGERLDDLTLRSGPSVIQQLDKNRRFLQVSLSGFIDQRGRFRGGLRELPLIGNEVFIVTKDKIETIHNLVEDGRTAIRFAVTDGEGYDIAFPIDGLLNTHIAVFGNTGSGKSNTVAALYSAVVKELRKRNRGDFERNVRMVLFDFNGEYAGKDCITTEKHVYHLSTAEPGDRLPLPTDVLANIEMLAILADATEKTQKPFLRRVLRLYDLVFSAQDPATYFLKVLREKVESTLRMTDKIRADLIMDYFESVLPEQDLEGEPTNLWTGLQWHNKSSCFHTPQDTYYDQHHHMIPQTYIYKLCEQFKFSADFLSNFITLMYVQLITDILTNRAQNEHIAPVINRLVGRRGDIEKIFDFNPAADLWKKNVVIISLNKVNLDMRKTIPLLVAKRLYQDHKANQNKKSLTMIIDEAHNILSTESFRESESWKDYRLETFEEIIKEGRKFGVFVTISSQRPNDISPTITSQAHNYFIHRLVNQRDLATISSAVSYIDKISEASIPTLPVGTCIFSGVAGQMPLKLRVRPLLEAEQPRSDTLRFDAIVPKN